MWRLDLKCPFFGHIITSIPYFSTWYAGGKSPRWIAAELNTLGVPSLIGAVVPFTFIGIMPTNRALLAPGRDLGTAETRSFLEHWAKLHAVRTGLSLAATMLYVYLTLGS